MAILIRRILFALFASVLFCAASSEAAPRRIVLCIGDGMGFQQVRAAGIYADGRGGNLIFERFPFKARVKTSTALGRITDSAAAATAMATGHKVKRGVISLAVPGGAEEMPTILEQYRSSGKRTGLVTTSYVTDATPASFGAHASDRSDYRGIAEDLLFGSRPNVLLGGGGKGMTEEGAVQAGYRVVKTAAELHAAVPAKPAYLSGQFGSAAMPFEYDGLENLPHLSEMTRAALALLEDDPDGFFLMVEGGLIDYAGHANDIRRSIGETLEFAHTVEAIMEWAGDRDDVLVIVTADHETGGLAVLQNNGRRQYPEVEWSTDWHTNALVPLFAIGDGAGYFQGTMDNTSIHALLLQQGFSGSRFAVLGSPQSAALP